MILPGQDPAAIDQAAHALARGELVAFPTETVYGLGADAGSDAAVAGIFAAKGRPSDHPLIVHLARPGQATQFAAAVPPVAQALMDAFWPGPLTLILPRRAGMAAAAAGGQDSIAVRCPAHPVALALLLACENLGVQGLAGPSANPFGRVSPTSARHVSDEFGPGLMVLDGGPCDVGIESAIVDCTRSEPVLLRPGVLTLAQLQAAAGCPIRRVGEADARQLGQSPRASGMLESHYAPRATLRLMDAAALKTALAVLGSEAVPIAIYARTPLKLQAAGITLRRMPDDASEAARQLFAVLREFDQGGARLIWVETPPADPAWDGVRDRLTRAAAKA